MLQYNYIRYTVSNICTFIFCFLDTKYYHWYCTKTVFEISNNRIILSTATSTAMNVAFFERQWNSDIHREQNVMVHAAMVQLSLLCINMDMLTAYRILLLEIRVMWTIIRLKEKTDIILLRWGKYWSVTLWHCWSYAFCSFVMSLCTVTNEKQKD